MQRDRPVSLDAVVAISPLVIGVCLLLVALAAWGSYCRLLHDYSSHAATLRFMDGLDKVTPKLEVAEWDLMDSPGSDDSPPTPANPRHAAVNVRRAAAALEKVVGGNRRLRALLEELDTLHKELKHADIMRGEAGYEPLRHRIRDVIDKCEWMKRERAVFVPGWIVEKRKKLRQLSTVVFTLGAISLTIGVLFSNSWLSDVRERRRIAQQRLESQTRNKGD
jgi:hypothetical protein